jgi:hypothetical protein
MSQDNLLLRPSPCRAISRTDIAPRWLAEGLTEMKAKTISSQAHAKTAPAGDYAIKGPHQTSGFKKDTDAVGGGYTVRYRLGDRRPTMGLERG